MADLATLEELCAGRAETPDAVRELIAAGRLPAASAVDDAGVERFPHDYFALLDDAGSVDALRDRFEARYVVAADTYGAIAGPDELDDAWYDYLAGRFGALYLDAEPESAVRARPPERVDRAPARGAGARGLALARPARGAGARAGGDGAARRAGRRRRARPVRPPRARRARGVPGGVRGAAGVGAAQPAVARARRSKSSCSRRVNGPAVPSPIGAPSSRTSGTTGSDVAETKASGAAASTSRGSERSSAAIPSSARPVQELAARHAGEGAVRERRRDEHAVDDREDVGGERLGDVALRRQPEARRRRRPRGRGRGRRGRRPSRSP